MVPRMLLDPAGLEQRLAQGMIHPPLTPQRELANSPLCIRLVDYHLRGCAWSVFGHSAGRIVLVKSLHVQVRFLIRLRFREEVYSLMNNSQAGALGVQCIVLRNTGSMSTPLLLRISIYQTVIRDNGVPIKTLHMTRYRPRVEAVEASNASKLTSTTAVPRS
jgi:hypothetical protein